MNDSQEQLVSEPRKVRYIWIVYLLLYALAVPWYWPEGYRGPLVLGFPAVGGGVAGGGADVGRLDGLCDPSLLD